MKKVMYALILPLIVISGLVLAQQKKADTSKEPAPRPLSAAEIKAEREKWEATPEGKRYKLWEASSAGKKVYAAEAKIRPYINTLTNMQAVVTSLSLPPGSRLGFGIMVKINGEDFILSFGREESNEFQQLHKLQVNDKLIIRSQFVSHAPKYAYPILSAEYVELDSRPVYKRAPRKGGC